MGPAAAGPPCVTIATGAGVPASPRVGGRRGLGPRGHANRGSRSVTPIARLRDDRGRRSNARGRPRRRRDGPPWEDSCPRPASHAPPARRAGRTLPCRLSGRGTRLDLRAAGGRRPDPLARPVGHPVPARGEPGAPCPHAVGPADRRPLERSGPCPGAAGRRPGALLPPGDRAATWLRGVAGGPAPAVPRLRHAAGGLRGPAGLAGRARLHHDPAAGPGGLLGCGGAAPRAPRDHHLRRRHARLGEDRPPVAGGAAHARSSGRETSWPRTSGSCRIRTRTSAAAWTRRCVAWSRRRATRRRARSGGAASRTGRSGSCCGSSGSGAGWTSGTWSAAPSFPGCRGSPG